MFKVVLKIFFNPMLCVVKMLSRTTTVIIYFDEPFDGSSRKWYSGFIAIKSHSGYFSGEFAATFPVNSDWPFDYRA